MNPSDLAIVFALSFLGLGSGLGCLLTWGIPKLVRYGKARIIVIDPDTRSLNPDVWVKISHGGFQLGKKRYLLDGKAKHGGKYSTWIVDPKGWNYPIPENKENKEDHEGFMYRAPTRAETFDSRLELAVLEPSNAESYHRALHRHAWHDVLKSGEEGDKYPWMPAAIIGGVLAVLIIIGGIVYIITHLPVPSAGA
jgi:hypothetical protein